MLPQSVFSALIALTTLATTRIAAQVPRPTVAEQLVREFVRTHKELAAVELAVDSAGRCTTVAATDPKDVGHPCDADENGPMRTGDAYVEPPTNDDPVYDITQALHDTTGRLIGAVGMDIRPAAGQDSVAVLMVARDLLRELEASIPSKRWLFQEAQR
ncbi:MAG: PDC sensor domain-containing protein [Gemmatimonadales bacterium]